MRPCTRSPLARAKQPLAVAIAILLALPVAASAAFGQAATPALGDTAGSRAVVASGASSVPLLRANHVTSRIRVDGRLDDEAWSSAPVATDFRQSWPDDGKPATQRTEARIVYDDVALYVGVRLFDTRPDSIAAQLARRDASNIYSDWVHVVVDSYFDRRTGFRFSTNPKGVMKDVRHFDDNNEDLLWDAVWEVQTTVDSLGWIAEFRIPFSQLRFSGTRQGASRTWGLNIGRDLARREERSNWSYTPQNANAFVSRFGNLDGLDRIPSPGRLELLPYASNSFARRPGESANPFYRKNDNTPSVGLDFKYGVTSGLTLTGTVNPDFGQVELDPAFVNLSAFEQFLPERRPFFIEGGEIFRFGRFPSNNNFGSGTDQFFYSRRVGRAPQRNAGQPDVLGRRPLFFDSPTQTSILGAVKLSGKTRGGWSIGVLDAVTGAEEAQLLQRVPDPGSPGDSINRRRTTPVEPASNYFLGRTRKDFNRGNTVVGALLSNVRRDLGVRDEPFDTATSGRMDGPEVFRNSLRQDATMVGVDFEHSWKQREWSMGGFLAASNVRGSKASITATQLAPYRLLQRPDDDREVDPNRESLTGHVSALSVARRGGQHWDFSLALQEYSPTLEVNDFGIGTTTDRRGVGTFVGYRENKPGRRYRSYGAYAFTNHVYNFDGVSMFQGLGVGTYGNLRNFMTYEVGGRANPAAYNDRLLRGGPLARNPVQYSTNGSLRSDGRKPIVVVGYFNMRRDQSGEWGRDIGLNFEARPTTSVRLVVEPGLSRGHSTRQYVMARSDALATNTYGARYIFADVDATTVQMLTRVNWTFSPRMSLELVAQPFLSSGDYDNYKEFRTPRELEFTRYGRDGGSTLVAQTRTETLPGGETRTVPTGNFTVDPDGPTGAAGEFTVSNRDFTVRSLRGSAVMRWEYRPGSTLFFVWQQQRAGSSTDGTVRGRDFSELLNDRVENVFVVKATYWLAR